VKALDLMRKRDLRCEIKTKGNPIKDKQGVSLLYKMQKKPTLSKNINDLEEIDDFQIIL